MLKYDVMTESFEEVIVLGSPALFTSQHLDRTTLPRGYYLYEMRFDGDHPGEAAQLANFIYVNHFGSLITHKEIMLPGNGVLDLKPNDIVRVSGEHTGIKDFIAKHSV